MSRLERLKKWKEEKELKRKLDAMEKARSKPSFKVVHMTYKDIQLYQKDKAVSGKVAKVYFTQFLQIAIDELHSLCFVSFMFCRHFFCNRSSLISTRKHLIFRLLLLKSYSI